STSWLESNPGQRRTGKSAGNSAPSVTISCFWQFHVSHFGGAIQGAGFKPALNNTISSSGLVELDFHAALGGRARHHGLVPALHLRVLRQIHPMALMAP